MWRCEVRAMGEDGKVFDVHTLEDAQLPTLLAKIIVWWTIHGEALKYTFEIQEVQGE